MLHTLASLRLMTVSNLSSRIWKIDAAFKERNAKWHDVILNFSSPRRNYKAFPQLQRNMSVWGGGL